MAGSYRDLANEVFNMAKIIRIGELDNAPRTLFPVRVLGMQDLYFLADFFHVPILYDEKGLNEFNAEYGVIHDGVLYFLEHTEEFSNEARHDNESHD